MKGSTLWWHERGNRKIRDDNYIEIKRYDEHYIIEGNELVEEDLKKKR